MQKNRSKGQTKTEPKELLARTLDETASENGKEYERDH